MASILERPLEDFREHSRLRREFHYGGAKDWKLREAYERIQRAMGFTLSRVTPPSAIDGAGVDGSLFVFKPLGALPRGYTIANGPGPRTKPGGDPIYHSCVALDGVIVHDPHHSRAGLTEIEEFELLISVVL